MVGRNFKAKELMIPKIRDQWSGVVESWKTGEV